MIFAAVSGKVARTLVLICSALFVGASGYLALRRLVWVWRDRRRRWGHHVFYLLTWGCIGGVVWLLGTLVYHLPALDPHDRVTWEYAALLFGAAVGMTGVAVHQGRLRQQGLHI